MASEAAEVFVYTRVGEGAVVPKDVVRVRIDPTVLVIPIDAFSNCKALKEIVLHDGLREIGHGAFDSCSALNDIHLYDGVESIGMSAFFCCTALKGLQLSDGVERIGQGAFFGCNFTKYRSPPLVTTISVGMFNGCKNIFFPGVHRKYYSSRRPSVRMVLFLAKCCSLSQHCG
jgi:hypothetical protein